MVNKRSPVKVPSGNVNGVQADEENVAAKKQKYDITDLLTKVNELLENFNYDLALKFSEKALLIEPENTKVLETMGNICAELGNTDSAKQYYLKAVSIQPHEGHVKYLYLGQLSEGAESVTYYKQAIDIMNSVLTRDGENSSVSARDISNVFCSLAELYMTDCCMDEGAEQLCEKSCQQALEMDGENPEAYLVMCNLLLTKGDIEAAKNIATKMYDVWTSLSQSEDDAIVDLMSYESRMTLMKILIEVDFCDKVVNIGDQLLEENEDDIRIWYYIGLSKSLLNEAEGQRHYLDTALFLYEKNHHEDEDMLSHLKELISNCPVEDITEDDVKEETKSDDNHKVMDVDG